MKLLYKIYTLLKYYPDRKIKQLFRNPGKSLASVESLKYNIILFCPFNPHQINIIREGIWAHACRLRGAEVKMLSYDLELPAIDFLPPGTKKDLKVSYWIVNKLFKYLQLNPIHLSKYSLAENDPDSCETLTPDDITELKYSGIKLGDLVIASTIRYFYCNGPEWDNPVFLNKAREFAFSAIKLTAIYEKVLLDNRPDKIISSHGIYVSWGTLFRVARKLNIPIDIYGGSYRKNTVRFNHNIPNAPFPEGEWDMYKDRSLTESELKQVEEYIPTRDTQSEDSISLFSGDNHMPENLKVFLNNARGTNKKMFCLFTTISWDGYMYKKDDTSFRNMIEWMTMTVDYFKNRTDSYLIVKSHPAEVHYNVPSKYRIRNIIDPELPGHILFLDETANVKPVNLYNHIDVGLIYTSTVSLEMALRNIPVLTAGAGGHYSYRGFTIDPGSQSEYFKILGELIKGEHKYSPDIEMAKKYLYFRFFGESLSNNLVNVENYRITRYNFSSIEELAPGMNKELDIICNGILNDTKFIY